VFLLIAVDHPAISLLKLLFNKLPRFTFSNSLPYKSSLLSKLHKENINSAVSFHYFHNLSIPTPLDYLIRRPSVTPIYKSYPTNIQPLLRMKRILNQYQLTLLPADKTKQLIIIETRVLHDELSIHLSDTDTYKLLNMEEYIHLEHLQREMTIQAASFYHNSKLIQPRPSKRYIYFVPKVHKPLSEWRKTNHPKMRPIISDAGSITNRVAKYLLKHLQIFENSFATTVTSSLATAHSIYDINQSLELRGKKVRLATLDVESLYTKIPQDHLLDIINGYLNGTQMEDKEKQSFMNFLLVIIKCNTFQVNNRFYLQTIGLPMGGSMSGTLANIYLGHLEKSIYKDPGIILYNRFVDDIFLLTTYEHEDMLDFISKLSNEFKLRLTASHNTFSVTFLDMNISVNFHENIIDIYPFSKNIIQFPLPSTLCRKPMFEDINIIKGQILRTWRFSNNDVSFTSVIQNYFCLLQGNNYHRMILHYLLKFMLPIKLKNGIYSTSIVLCTTCNPVTLPL
jgi:hypothetical protein